MPPLMSENSLIAIDARRRIARRIIPYVFVLYVIAFLDRVNVSYAALEMTHDLGFTAEVFGFGAGIFFIGYFLLEIPSTLVVENWSARRWISRIMISWGILCILIGFIRDAREFYVLRFLLGAAEAGFFPGIIVYLSHWFRSSDRARMIALFMAALPISNIFGAPISGVLLGVDWFGLAGWRWMFILEGIPAVVFGVITAFYLTDWPSQATWLTAEQREWITQELERERQLKKASHGYSVWEALRQREVIILSIAYFFAVTSAYGFTFWLPTYTKRLSGLPNLTVTFLVAIPYCAALLTMLLVGWSSDRTAERRWHTAIPLFVIGSGMLLITLTQDRAIWSFAVFCLIGAALYGYLPSFWSLPTQFLTASSAAAAIGLINSVGNLGGFVGPYLMGYVNTTTNSFAVGMLYLSGSACLAGSLILTLRPRKVFLQL
jgi:sugar phosphate permease